MTLAPGTRLGPYEIVSAIGAGGMARVYLANDGRLTRQVAIKVLAADLIASERARERFEREARTIAALNHPNICVMHDVGRLDDQLYLVLEYLEGETLATRIAGHATRPLRLLDAMSIGAQVADALAAAHAQGIVHRDVKPSNVMLTRSGVKLMDFGVAHVRDEEPGGAGAAPTRTAAAPLTGTGQLVGTLDYMAPEQLDGRPVDARTDVFALGALLYEMLTARRAFHADSRSGLIGAILRDDPAPMLAMASGDAAAPASRTDAATRRSLRRLDGIVQRCLAKAPEERWQSAKDVAHQLRALAQEHQTAGEASAPEAAPTRRGVRGLAVAALALVAAAGLFASRSPDGARAGAIPLLRARLELGEMAVRGVSSFSLSHNGRWLALMGFDRAAVLDLGTGELSAVPGWIGLQAAWSQDDTRLVLSSGTTSIRSFEVLGGRVGAATDIPPTPERADCPAISGDDLLMGSVRGPIMKTSLLRRTDWVPASTLDSTVGEVGHSCPQALADGRTVIYTSMHTDSSQNKVYLGVLGDSSRTELLAGDVRNVRFVAPHWLLYVVGGNLVAQRLDVVSRTLTGGRVTLAKNFGGGAFSASDTGLLVTSQGNETRLEWFDRRGMSLKTEVAGRFVQPMLSPDQDKIVMHATDANGSLYVLAYDIKRGLLTRVTAGAGQDSYPIWTPDSASIVFARGLGGGRNQIVTSKLDGSGERVLLESTTGALYPDDVVLQDGTVIVEQYGMPGAPDLVSVPWAGGQPARTVLATPFRELDSSISTDGRWLAYEGDRSGTRDVYIQPFRREGASIQVSAAGGSSPRWRRDGRELYFMQPDSTIAAVAVTTTGDTLTVSKQVPLFKMAMPNLGGPQYDVAADGQRFLVNVLRTSAIDLVVNWPALMGEQPPPSPRWWPERR